MTRKPLLTRFLPLAFFAVCIGFFAVGLTRDPSKIPSEMIDRPLPEFELTSLYDPAVTLTPEDFRGEIALLNVFGSWCQACLVEHPTLMDMAARGEVKLIGVNWRDTREKADIWLARHGDAYAEIIFDNDSELAIEMGVTGAPETFILDADLKIRYKHVGPITPDVRDNIIRPILERIRSEGAGE